MGDIMTEVKYLSNKELVNELYRSNNPSWSLEEKKRRQELRDEIIRLLEEPWRRLRECISLEEHKEKMKDLFDKFYNELDSINYQHKIKHQINIIKKRVKNEQNKLG